MTLPMGATSCADPEMDEQLMESPGEYLDKATVKKSGKSTNGIDKAKGCGR